ncbi:HD domain-containing phosphohydrolase, partial [Poseidonibacter sp.]|uniref:HD-GYP domain-containing protein n=1 Tax=Poseidonibacter sp. TaxID=2321188 RepID=UPI003C72ACE7
EVFKELWGYIKNGKTWRGIIKNMNKNGQSYWVNTTIIPIKDINNNIVEYMAIRHNLTEILNLHKEIEETQREIIYRMGEIGETRSKETGNHVKRVAQYSKDLALLYGMSIRESNILFTASPMHDIGKVGIPDSILKKPSKLTPEEFEIMKKHSEIGYNILKSSNREVLKAATIISLTHHEKYDGTGYPKGLKGEDIHIYGRITAIADVFDALGSQRVYKKAWKDEDIFQLLKDNKGKHFDPTLLDLFMSNINIFLETRKKYQD